MRTVLSLAAIGWLVIYAGCAVPHVAVKVVTEEYVETETEEWAVHDENRPAPPAITPGSVLGAAPSDALVLFDGSDLSAWAPARGDTIRWILGDGYMETVGRTGSLITKQGFGSCQLHLEFATPAEATGTGQGRGNSGLFLMSTYEVQILDSYENATYPDGQCSAVYGRAVPQVNASRRPGEWQTYDIIFHRPVFDGDKVVRKATFTIFHNGVLVHDHVAIGGGTTWAGRADDPGYRPHEDKLPLTLQDHSNPVRFRNIWIRELAD
ncbi:DUF1080 domain-containing protein [Candidatus Neomarinimicrobiota bacterium]